MVALNTGRDFKVTQILVQNFRLCYLLTVRQFNRFMPQFSLLQRTLLFYVAGLLCGLDELK